MTPLTDGRRLLACHVYQPVRDVPLIVGKPAVARVFANWEEQTGVHPDHQVEEFNAQVELYGPGNRLVGQHTVKFVRPDLWAERGVNLKAAEQSAQLAFTPTADMQGALLSILRVAQAPGDDGAQYRTRCPLKLWDRQPTLSIDFVALRFDEWLDHPERLDAMMPTLQRIADASVDYAMQQFPFASIAATPVRIRQAEIEIPPMLPADSQPEFECIAGCILNGLNFGSSIFGVAYGGGLRYSGIRNWLLEGNKADVVVVLGPADRLKGGKADATLRDGQGLVMVLGGDSAEYFPRYVNGVVHELGHVLELSHLPFIPDSPTAVADRARVVPLRNGTPPFWHEGIEALRISRDGQTFWNKSSIEGNEQGEKLFPLMFPGTIPVDDAFIANHHYRKIQMLLEELDR